MLLTLKYALISSCLLSLAAFPASAADAQRLPGVPAVADSSAMTAPSCNVAGANQSLPAFLSWAPEPPMGWNSWDCFATTVTEAQARFTADYMAAHLKAHGWQYLVVDIQWYEPGAADYGYKAGAELAMDGYGRLQPAVNRFPSSADGKGFKVLADYAHSKGLKFGVHLMRGIPRKAVEKNLPILGTNYHAKDVADLNRPCAWNPDMWGVDMKKPGAQAYYDSVFALLAQWGVDYVKVDDIARPYHDNEPEIAAVRRAIDKSGRPIVLSLSPGETVRDAAAHVVRHANLWRISDDFWDSYGSFYDQFARLEKWNDVREPGAWPDADMLPLGVLAMGSRKTNFTPDEQVALMTLWCVARSPLMFGGDMAKMDDATLALLSNDAVLAVDRASDHNRPLAAEAPWKVWTADDPKTGGKYLAVFNAPEPTPLEKEQAKAYGANVKIDPAAERIPHATFRADTEKLLGVKATKAVDLWTGKTVPVENGVILLEVPHHGARLIEVR